MQPKEGVAGGAVGFYDDPRLPAGCLLFAAASGATPEGARPGCRGAVRVR